MEKESKKIMYEALLLNNAFWNELHAVNDDSEYSRYHIQCKDAYMSLSSQYHSIIGYQGSTEDELISHVASLQLTNEQKREIKKFRKEPMFIRISGQTALSQKEELQNVLGTEITSKGVTIADENGARVAFKTVDVLDEEWEEFSNKLSELLSTGQINEEQYDKYIQSLGYIYDYFMSESKGEQVPFRTLSDSEYSEIEKQAEYEGVSFEEQMRQTNANLKYDLEEIQEAAEIAMKKIR